MIDDITPDFSSVCSSILANDVMMNCEIKDYIIISCKTIFAEITLGEMKSKILDEIFIKVYTEAFRDCTIIKKGFYDIFLIATDIQRGSGGCHVISNKDCFFCGLFLYRLA